ncbi:hypothetical protein MMC18_004517 [Xylographa bjoerkii]|nr:hypothetical protein [Xylographa bjoerkii]
MIFDRLLIGLHSQARIHAGRLTKYRYASSSLLSMTHHLRLPAKVFGFLGTGAFISFFAQLKKDRVSEIRHVQVKGCPFKVFASKYSSSYATYDFVEALHMFPGLKLDTLTVEEPYHDEGDCGGFGDTGASYDLSVFIDSDGWKTLIYVNRTTKPLKGWKAKDGKGSGAAVWLYRALKPGMKPEDEDEVTQEEADQQYVGVAPDSGGDKNTEEENEQSNGVKYKSFLRMQMETKTTYPLRKDAMLVAERGNGAKYVQDGSGLSRDLKKMLAEMSWAEVVEKRLIGQEIDT